jgi:hypothetical protein
MTLAVEQPVQEITAIRWRSRARVVGRVRSMRVQPWAGVATLEVVLRDDTGGINVVFLGRRHVAGIRLGATLEVEGMVGLHHDRLAILNPSFEVGAHG